MVRRKRSIGWNILLGAASLVIIGWTLFPVFWMLSTSFKNPTAVYANPPEIIPKEPSAAGYQRIATGTVGYTPISRFFLNSGIVALATVIIAIIAALLASYALSRLKFAFRKGVMIGVLVTQMFPLVVLLTPLYILYFRIHLINTYQGLVLAFTAFTLPFCIWMLKSFADTIPQELDEAAIIDGCTRMGILRQILIPLLVPGIIATGVFSFLDAWNNLLFPMTLTTDISMKTLPPGMIMAFGGEFKHDWGGMMAASVLVALPVVLILVFLQRYLVEGLTAGSIKE
ncbi:carbohydrate ABC transporter permease [Leadbettera azotonutricia]|uniref:Inner membrane ABC transporter permease protein YcjP n=1 Tax=Leadbettera azotonutricia (strain ATCC BAA-888 / DSM 13862 / ZAS-9) TaxID=545695 RepID=F5Y9E7_LEAAZ|nr:carbohydrate ABC transporter permease [Leadbettera azotonutricia]AEF80261.1 inner membrane ABC transporter permease protein YcjP [Leadbettera azotonutricia ZAS-9]